MRPAAVLQLDQMDCGPACLRYVLNCFGGDATVTDIRRRCEFSDHGLSLLGMSRVAPQLGLGARFYEASKADPSLGELTPWIAQLQGEDDGAPHYVVVDDISNSRALLMDPTVGRVRVPLGTFTARWTGVMASFTSVGVTPRRRDDFGWMRGWIKEKPRPRYITASLLGALLTGLIGVVSAYVLKGVADAMLSAPFSSSFWIALVSLLAFFLIQYVLNAGTTYVTEFLAARMTNVSSSRVADQVRSLPWGHVSQMRHGDLVNRLKDPADVERFLIITCGQLASTVLGFVIGLAWVTALYPGLIPAVIVAVGLALGSFVFFRRRLVSVSYRQKSRQVAIDTGLMDYARCREVLTAASAQDLLLDRFRIRLAELNRLHVHRVSLLVVMGFFAALCPLIVMGWAVFQLWNWGNGNLGHISDLVFQVSAISFIFSGISSALGLVAGLDTMRVSFDRIMDVELGSETGAAPRPVSISDTALARLEEFEFTIGASPAVMSLAIEHGSGCGPTLVSLTGENGIGKSSLLRALAGAAPSSGGRAQFCNQRLSTCADFQSQVAYMPQQDQLFTGTMLENITLGRRVSPERMNEIASDLELPRNARTLAELASIPIRNGGENLSGGQSRRIALARTLVVPKPVLLLDEPFVGLDQNSVDKFLSVLRSQSCELIVVTSHDDYLLAQCDQVFELEGADGLVSSPVGAPRELAVTTRGSRRTRQAC